MISSHPKSPENVYFQQNKLCARVQYICEIRRKRKDLKLFLENNENQNSLAILMTNIKSYFV